jgi:hypothetical protein
MNRSKRHIVLITSTLAAFTAAAAGATLAGEGRQTQATAAACKTQTPPASCGKQVSASAAKAVQAKAAQDVAAKQAAKRRQQPSP